ncbi:unnamed protein product [Albugo candida]|uniref:Uncharacterized protein n=1 Tax=Albugo candida TaxID=65357 RepID=A0A024GQG7_9STRA|nr:unnamed protein product [Albugo candida]|eukprot:CCI48946.1 unnamed protein product [Albugo candida]
MFHDVVEIIVSSALMHLCDKTKHVVVAITCESLPIASVLLSFSLATIFCAFLCGFLYFCDVYITNKLFFAAHQAFRTPLRPRTLRMHIWRFLFPLLVLGSHP